VPDGGEALSSQKGRRTYSAKSPPAAFPSGEKRGWRILSSPRRGKGQKFYRGANIADVRIFPFRPHIPSSSSSSSSFPHVLPHNCSGRQS